MRKYSKNCERLRFVSIQEEEKLNNFKIHVIKYLNLILETETNNQKYFVMINKTSQNQNICE